MTRQQEGHHLVAQLLGTALVLLFCAASATCRRSSGDKFSAMFGRLAITLGSASFQTAKKC
jgi:hypothetical protein